MNSQYFHTFLVSDLKWDRLEEEEVQEGGLVVVQEEGLEVEVVEVDLVGGVEEGGGGEGECLKVLQLKL